MRITKKYRACPRHENRGSIPAPYGQLANQFVSAGWTVDFNEDPETVLFIQKGKHAFGIIYGDNNSNVWAVYSPEDGEFITQFRSAKDLFRVITAIIG